MQQYMNSVAASGGGGGTAYAQKFVNAANSGQPPSALRKFATPA